MNRVRQSAFARSFLLPLALIGLFLCTSACHTYTLIKPSEVTDHDKVRVAKTDGERDLLHDSELGTDTIRGHELRETERESHDRVLVIPLD